MTTGNKTLTAIPTDLIDVGHHFTSVFHSNRQLNSANYALTMRLFHVLIAQGYWERLVLRTRNRIVTRIKVILI